MNKSSENVVSRAINEYADKDIVPMYKNKGAEPAYIQSESEKASSLGMKTRNTANLNDKVSAVSFKEQVDTF